MNVRQVVNADDYEKLAKRRLPKMIFDFLATGAQDEITLRSNRSELQAIRLEPRALTAHQAVDTSSELLGVPLASPIIIPPMGLLSAAHPDADLELAHAAVAAGSVFMHSELSSVSMEEMVQAVGPERVWAQLSHRVTGDRADYLARLRNLGVTTIILSAEVQRGQKKEGDLRNGLSKLPPQLSPALVADFARHPKWVYSWLRGRDVTFADQSIDGRPIRLNELYDWMSNFGEYFVGNDWDALERVRSLWSGRTVVKGVNSTFDASAALQIGADAIFVSNMGGRYFDGQEATITTLPEIVDMVRRSGSDVPIMVDGGFRRGADVLKALALGASAVGVGRPFVYSLVDGGRRGARRLFDMLDTEFSTVLADVGCDSLRGVTPGVLRSQVGIPNLDPAEAISA